jgi:4-aminobutyrate aminotransferase
MAGHPVACAAANAHLDEIEEQGIVTRAAHTGRLLLEGLESLKSNHPLVGDVRGLGMMLGLEAVRDRGSKEPAAKEMAKIVYRCYELGLLVFYGGIYSNVMEITPPLTLSEGEVAEGLEILDQAIGEVERGLIPDEKLGSYAGW